MWAIGLLFVVLIALTALGRLLRSSHFKGWQGERRVSAQLNQLEPTYYRVWHDVLWPYADGGLTQIDHLVLSEAGLFVIETKNRSGWIWADARQKQWCQQHAKQRFYFQNPLHQNYAHCQALTQHLADLAFPVHNVVVFVGKAEFKSKRPPAVLNQAELLSYLTEFKRVTPLSSASQRHIALKIDQQRLPNTWRNRQRHLSYIRQKHQKTQS